MPDEHLAELLREDSESVALPQVRGTAARPGNKHLARLHVFRPGKPTLTFQYAQLLSHSEWSPESFSVPFGSELRSWIIRVTGRNHWEIYDYITQHRCAWIRQSERDFSEDGEPVITSIDVVEVVPKD